MNYFLLYYKVRSCELQNSSTSMNKHQGAHTQKYLWRFIAKVNILKSSLCNNKDVMCQIFIPMSFSVSNFIFMINCCITAKKKAKKTFIKVYCGYGSSELLLSMCTQVLIRFKLPVFSSFKKLKKISEIVYELPL